MDDFSDIRGRLSFPKNPLQAGFPSLFLCVQEVDEVTLQYRFEQRPIMPVMLRLQSKSDRKSSDSNLGSLVPSGLGNCHVPTKELASRYDD